MASFEPPATAIVPGPQAVMVAATARAAETQTATASDSAPGAPAGALAESLALAAMGGLLGGLAAYVAFNGYQTSTMNFQTFSQVAFAFAVTRSLLVQGLTYALIMGLVGGLMPAIKAARLPIATALREL